MVRSKITYYAMLTPERRYKIQQQIQAREAARAARIAVGLPPDSPEPEEDKEEQLSKLMEVADPKEDEVEQPAPGFNMAKA